MRNNQPDPEVATFGKTVLVTLAVTSEFKLTILISSILTQSLIFTMTFDFVDLLDYNYMYENQTVNKVNNFNHCKIEENPDLI